MAAGGSPAAAGAAAPSATMTEDSLVARGREVFFGESYCVMCHSIEGTRAAGIIGPNLTRIGSRTTIAAGVLENTPENLAAWLRDPQSVKPGNYMPTLWPLPDETTDAQEAQIQSEVDAIVAYLQSLGVDDAAQAQSEALPTLEFASMTSGGSYGDR